MLFPNSNYPVVEYGYGVSAGAQCPCCKEGKLFDATDKLRRCDHCFEAFPSMQRSLFAPNPVFEPDLMMDHYQSLQHYAHKPVKGERAVALSDFMLDIDRENLEEAAADAQLMFSALSAFAPGQVRLYFSGKKGFHLAVPAQVFGFEASELLGNVQRRMARKLSSTYGLELDYTAYSRARLFRVVGSRHSGTGRFKVEVRPQQLADLEALKEYAAMPRPALVTAQPVETPQARAWYEDALREEQAYQEALERQMDDPVDLPEGEYHPCIKTLLSEGPPMSDSRHKTYITLVGYFKAAGLSRQEAMSLLLPWTQEHPLTNTDKSRRELHYEMSADVRSIYASPRATFHCQYAMALKVCQTNCPKYIPMNVENIA